MKEKNEKKELVKLLNRIADLMEYTGENPFKIKAFRNGANALRSFTGDLTKLIDEKNPVKIKGIGKGILSVIKNYLQDEPVNELDVLLEKVPRGIDELFEIKGLGIKKIKFLAEKFGVSDINSLEHLARSGELNSVKNFGSKTTEKILDEIKKLKERKKNMLLNQAEELAEKIKSEIKGKIAFVKKAEISGTLRRGYEIISEIIIIAETEANEKENFETELKKIFDYETQTDENNFLRYKIKNFGEREIYVYLAVSKADFVKKNFVLTGNGEFIKHFNLQGEFSKEREIFKSNNIPFVIPELRERAPDEIPVKNSDLCFGEMKGMLHFHTVWSDGHNSLEEMISAGSKLGFEYFAVCDHSKSAYYANGLDENRLSEQREEIRRISEKLNLPILQGNEVDILADGSLDFPDEILANLDFVIASVHSSFNLSEDEMTARIVKAVENPYVNALGHPTGRLLMRRNAYAVNIKKVIDACAANNVAIEINANPWRLDLDWRNIEYAKNKGARFTINADAHAIEEINYTKYGVKIARKGALQKSDVINYLSLDEFKEFVGR